jgi:hypothetical protein
MRCFGSPVSASKRSFNLGGKALKATRVRAGHAHHMPPGAGGVIHFWCCSGAFLSAPPDPNGICLSRFFSTRGPQNLAVLFFVFSALVA